MRCTRPQPAYISQFILPGFSELSQSKHLEMLQMRLFTACCECLRINQVMFHHWLLIFDPLFHSHTRKRQLLNDKKLWNYRDKWALNLARCCFLLFSTSENRKVKNTEQESIWLTSQQAILSLNFLFSLQGFSFRCCQVQDRKQKKYKLENWLELPIHQRLVYKEKTGRRRYKINYHNFHELL